MPTTSSHRVHPEPLMTSKLDQLKTMTVVVADTGDIELIPPFARPTARLIRR